MSTIKTHTGIMFDPLEPKSEQIAMEDIAHALSMLCRANGHFKHFYSVGQHSINCMKEAKARGLSVRIQLACLLHDASEAYLSDVTRPVKEKLPQYKQIEAALQEMIWNKWLAVPLDEKERTIVFEIDDALLVHEFLELMDTQLTDTVPELSSVPAFEFTGFEACKEEFIHLLQQVNENAQ